MDRPWLILPRILGVDDPPVDDDMHAGAAENGVVAEAADVQAQEHAVVGEADEHDDPPVDDDMHAGAAENGVVAEAADVQAQEHAVVGEADEHVVVAAVEAQEEQHAPVWEADDEFELDPLVLLEERVVDVNTNLAASAAAHEVHGAGDPDFAVSVAAPPFLTYLVAGPNSHPDPASPDMSPYIIATGPFCLLVHFAVAPSYGTNFNRDPDDSHLVVVRHFLREGDGEIGACAVRVPDRPNDDPDMPALSNIESVGLVCNQDTGDYQIAELFVTTGAPEAAVAYIRTDHGVWQGNYFVNPFGASCLRDWVPHGAVSINSTVFWYDLSWGIISCDLAEPYLLQVLNFHRLPTGRILLRTEGRAIPDLHSDRCVAVSGNLLRYVEIIINPQQPATVNMWYRDMEEYPWRWVTNYRVSFTDIWDDESYALTGLPRNIPILAGVSPVDPNVVYFTLNQRLFGVNVPEHTVVHCEEYDAPLNMPGPPDEEYAPLDMPGPPDESLTSRYLITWDLDNDGVINIGHHNPGEHSDHGDSSDGGPADEGEIEYEAP